MVRTSHGPDSAFLIHTFGATATAVESVDAGYFYATQFDLGSSGLTVTMIFP
jgi:hypothetical protein